MKGRSTSARSEDKEKRAELPRGGVQTFVDEARDGSWLDAESVGYYGPHNSSMDGLTLQSRTRVPYFKIEKSKEEGGGLSSSIPKEA